MTRIVYCFQPAIEAFFPTGRLNPAKVSRNSRGGELSTKWEGISFLIPLGGGECIHRFSESAYLERRLRFMHWWRVPPVGAPGQD